MDHLVEQKLDEIKTFMSHQVYAKKEILTLAEAAAYAGISKSYLYKLTSTRMIPFYRPQSKLIYFKKIELDTWLTNNRHSTTLEMANCASLT